MLRPRICCLDLDTFFVSVERLINPALEGKPVVVGGRRGGGGVVTAASYEVRAFGVRSGMSILEATQLAPQAVFLPGRHEAYSDYSARARAIVERFSPVVRAASIDEHYIDFHGCERLYRAPHDADDDETIRRVVTEMTRAIRDELGLPSSAGIATSKSLAKVASGLAKPAGVLLVPSGAEAKTLAPLSVRKLPGIGPVSEQKLQRAGIHRLGELVAAPAALLRPIFGASTEAIRLAARGVGQSELGRERPAFREHDPDGELVGSISNERTFSERQPGESEAILSGLCERVAWRARKRGVVARTITLKLRYTSFDTVSRSRTVNATSSDLEIHRVALELYREARSGALPIRLLGVALSNLGRPGAQLELFAPPQARCRAIDSVRTKFGYDAVHLATTVTAADPFAPLPSSR